VWHLKAATRSVVIAISTAHKVDIPSMSVKLPESSLEHLPSAIREEGERPPAGSPNSSELTCGIHQDQQSRLIARGRLKDSPL
jgi:hypothetical protein